MVVISHAPDLSASDLRVFHTNDPTLSNGPIFVLYGASATSSSSTAASTRIQGHVFTPAGFVSYQRLAISPGHPTYSAVQCLSREEQGDEIVRALAFIIFKYFGDLPENAKDEWVQQSLTASRPDDALQIFGAKHAANLASRMVPVEHPADVVRGIETALGRHEVTSLDVDIVLPPGVVLEVPREQETNAYDDHGPDGTAVRYGPYASLVRLFGETLFLPTSKVQRAPSRPTAINRTLTFSKKQKENIRREMCELVDTEDSYIDKLNELVNNVAFDFREHARNKTAGSSSPDHAALKSLFPPSLDSIFELNSGFFDEIRKVAETTEDRAIADIEATLDSSQGSIEESIAIDDDASGAVAFGNVLVSWLPRFEAAYSGYIQAQPSFVRLVKQFSSGHSSTFAGRVHAIGEQKLMSLLIEPVQRLPRYSLYIDNIIKQLPIRHPALKQYLTAKDAIGKICDPNKLDSGDFRLARIRSLVTSWPDDFRPPCRFITAVEVVELTAGSLRQETGDPALLLLLFSGYLVFVKRLGASAFTSRNFMAELDRSGPHCLQSETVDSGLLFIGRKALSDFHFSQCHDSSDFRTTPVRPPLPRTTVSPNDDRIRLYRLTGVNEHRASKWLSDVMKARLEGRFSEAERESVKWEARSTEHMRTDLTLFAAIFEGDEMVVRDDRAKAAAIRIVIDPERHAKKLGPGESGVEAVLSVSVEGQGFFRLEVEALNERSTRDVLTETEFLPVLVKRLGNLLQMRSQIRNPLLTAYLLRHSSDILNALCLTVEQPDQPSTRSRTRRPQSPVKLLTNLFSSASLKDQPKAKESQPLQPSTSFENAPRLLPPQPSQRSKGVQDTCKTEDVALAQMTIIGKDGNNAVQDPFAVLEKTLQCYLLALQARKGNIVGSVVARRAFADEATVNELYNALLENSEEHERAAQASVDVLFASFEQFMQNAWKERLGPIISSQLLTDLQTKMDTLGPLAYDEYEESRLTDLAPQNRRALVAIVATLSDLLDGTRNDGDRGVLTAAITEAVVCDADPHDFISLFDRFVENQEALSPERPASSGTLSVPGSLSSTLTRSTKAGSVSSKASSLSKRLGLGSLRRDNNKSEQPKSSNSIPRSATRKALPPDPPVEIGRPVLSRAHSQDLDSRLSALRGAFSREPSTPQASDSGSRPGTSGSDKFGSPSTSLSSSPLKRSIATKKKRRSSLSDVTNLQTPGASPFWTNSASKKVDSIFLPGPNVVSPSKGLLPDTPLKSASLRLASPNKKENTPQVNRSQTVKAFSTQRSPGSEFPFRVPKPSTLTDAFTPPRQTSSSHRRSPSLIPVPKAPLSERIASGNTPAPLNVASFKHEKEPRELGVAEGYSRKHSVQSPEKLRQRAQAHSSAITAAESSLQSELLKIGQELMDIDTRLPPSARKPSQHEDHAIVANLNTRLKAVETKVAHMATNLHDRTTTLGKDIATSLEVSERKNKSLDTELRRANAENEVLYGRLNEELMKVFNQVKAGDGLEEMRIQLKESREEAARWKKEAAKLRRENIKLSSLVG